MLRTQMLCALTLLLALPTSAGGDQAAQATRSRPTVEERTALKLKGNVRRGEWAFAVCVGCHQAKGGGTVDGLFPRLQGQHPRVLIKEIADIRARVREVPVMHPLAKTLVDPQELVDTVAFIGTLPPPTEVGRGPGIELGLGEELYARDCQSCHGAKAQGDDAKFYPMLAGQHFKYLQRQALAIRDGKRKNADRAMVKVIKGYSDKQLNAVVDYASRLDAPPAVGSN